MEGEDLKGRFIPARAGNTTKVARVCVQRAVHPRAGGEHNTKLFYLQLLSGSSPRGRGTRGWFGTFFDALFFIPARAGNTVL